MKKEWNSLVSFFLVRTQFAGNAGAAARALQNCGFKKMAFVDPAFPKTHADLAKFAVGAKSLAEKAPVYKTLKEGLKGFKYVIGTSRRRGNYRKNILNLFELPALLESLPTAGKIAILFGHEANGLDNEELALCQYMVEIPADPGHESFNLGQAILLTAFELFRFRPSLPPPIQDVYPNVLDLEAMYDHLKEALMRIGFIKNDNPEHMPRILRNIFNRAHLTDPELRVLRGVSRQMIWAAKQIEKLTPKKSGKRAS